MKSSILISLLLLLAFSLQAQTPDCQRFRTGKYQNIDDGVSLSRIKRTEKYQIEKIGKKKVKLQVVWVDDCTYRLIFIKANKAFWADRPKGKPTPALIVRITDTSKRSYAHEAHFEGNTEQVYKSRFFVLD